MDVELPALYCPFPAPGLHPLTDEIQQESLAWGERYDLYPSAEYQAAMHGMKSSWWFGPAWPDADTERILLFMKHNEIITALVECWEPFLGDAGRFMDLIVRMSHTYEVPDAKILDSYPHFMAALEDVLPQIQALGTPTQYRRWIQTVRDDWRGNMLECWIGVQKFLDVNTYLTMRARSLNMHSVLIAADLAHGWKVPNDLLMRPDVRALRCLALTWTGVRNDARGFRLDASKGQCNFIPHLINETGCTEAEAISHSVGLMDSLMYRFAELHDRIINQDIPDSLRHHISNVARILRATIVYEKFVRHEWYEYAGDMAQDYAETPSSTAPPPYPALSWCWSV
ncbi:hypothetical protein [Streptomyces sp. NPDC056480]|uniref:terpene synthase family protein n=1 Tax=Streptomyces sp. NPDC056480 TaxID=3345833 RepID=UPI0036A0380D